MGLFAVRVRVFALDDPRRGRNLEMVVDTGAMYCVVPRDVLESLGIRPERRKTFTLADGRSITRDVGWAGLEYGGDDTHALVVFGDEGDAPLFGAFALEGLGLEVDPSHGVLRPARLWLLAASASPATA
ncbi:MAG: Retroviral aspartyl protease [Methanobacteriota archaeon]|nr:MAG: Retroviral aspartyl protease [Euryarchaeota archaeon]